MTQRVGGRRALGEVDGIFDPLARRFLHRLILAIVECSVREQLIPVDRDRIMLRNALELGPVALRVPFKVAPQTQRVHFDESRTSPRARTCDGLARGSVDTLDRVVFHPHSGHSVCDRAVAYGMPGVRVEDNSVEGVYAAAGEAIARARSGGGPTLIEVHTLRLWGHFEGDAEGYRPELKSVPEQDPIPIYRDQLLASGALEDGQYQGMQKIAGEQVEDAINFAKNSPTPDPLDHLSYVFCEGAHS